jgi:hypothetical protein
MSQAIESNVEYRNYKIRVSTAKHQSFTGSSAKTAYTPKIYNEDDDLINFNLDREEPFRSYEGAIAVAKAWIDYTEAKEAYFF